MQSLSLYKFFYLAIKQSFFDLGIKEPEIADYIANLLAEFARTDNLYKIRNAQGEKLTTVVEMLIEANYSFREREIKKHIGDYTLFMTGIFREYVKNQSFFQFYLEEGKRAYFYVFNFDRLAYVPGSYLFFELSKNFEFYSGALDYMKKRFFKETKSNDPFLDFSYQLSRYVH
ncbi:MAG: hypothetical protein LWW95_01445 [Candidatus Desulfofervidus auxilii]|nr:hypothetical protein [Candidatus Desulfofervidus auxilii]